MNRPIIMIVGRFFLKKKLIFLNISVAKFCTICEMMLLFCETPFLFCK